MDPTNHLFNSNVDKGLKEARDTVEARGNSYADTWRDAQWLALLAVGKQLGIPLTTDDARKLAAAALYDVKYQRLQGGYDADHLIDGINYAANLYAELKT